MVTSGELYRNIKNSLASAGVFSPDFEAREILREYVCDPLTDSRYNIAEDKLFAIQAAVKRRLTGEPLQYIFGKWEFYGYEFLVGRGVLIPRPETELIVDTALETANAGSLILDLCSGTGCIPISISLKTGARCYAAELYDEAFSYLEQNIAISKAYVHAVKADAFDNTLFGDISFDIICANPPYLTADEMSEMQKELYFEPETALYGGKDGLEFYRRLIPLWAGRLKSGGRFICEIGETQGAAVGEIMTAAGLYTHIIKDHGGLDRAAVGIDRS